MRINNYFQRTPPGQKTARMLQLEAKLGRTLEEDYREFYIEKQWGQTRLASRWGMPRNTIFHSSKRNGSRCWVEMLNLPIRGGEDQAPAAPQPQPACEACHNDTVPLERAHWLEATNGGSRWKDNTLLLCPNCHTNLDRGDPVLTEKLRAILLHRAASTALKNGHTAEQLLTTCRRIINARAFQLIEQPISSPEGTARN